LNLATIRVKNETRDKELDEEIQEELKEIEEAKVSILKSKLKIGINTLVGGAVGNKSEQANLQD
jgi:hypothetical protein